MKHRKNKEAHPLAEESNKTSKIAICIFLVITTLAVYWQALDHGFINYDDDKYVTKNLHI